LQVRWNEQRARLEQAERDYEDARRAETAAVALAQSTTSAAAELFRERFAALEPLVNDIYARLDPHPSFTKLDFRVETYRSKGTAVATVVDVVEDITANPMIVFSSAQANAVVLSVFLALGWASGDRGLPFVLLDDPLQALDDVNVLGFADLARRLRRQRQLVLATHEDRFADLLERKLTGRAEGEALIIHQFLGWSRSGPTVETRRIGPRNDLQLRVLAAG
jgi:DNA repair exonuclease SbcCD ATPase subunit